MKLSQLSEEELELYIRESCEGSEEYEEKKRKDIQVKTLNSVIGVLKKAVSCLECCKTALKDGNIASMQANLSKSSAGILNSYRRIQDTFPLCQTEQTKEKSYEDVDLEFEEQEMGILHILIPERLPERITKNGHYYSNVVNQRYRKAFEKEFRQKRHAVYDEKVVIYILTHYSKEQEMKDHDNLEAKQMIDLIANYLLIDDGPKFCAQYMDYCMDERTCTEIFVVPQMYFIDFLKKKR